MKPKHDVAFSRDPAIPGVEACRVLDACHVIPSHFHETVYTLTLMEAGAGYCLDSLSSETLLKPGGLGLINPGRVHTCVPDQNRPMTYKMIYVDIGLMQDLVSDVCEKTGLFPFFDRMMTGDPGLIERYGRVFACLENASHTLETECAVLALVGALVARYTNLDQKISCAGKEHDAVSRSMEQLSTDLDQKLTLREVAETVGLSRYHFLRVFKQHTGISPHVFRTLKRIDRAKHLLKEGRGLSQVALDMGFSDQSHFTNSFRRYTGATPTQYLTV